MDEGLILSELHAHNLQGPVTHFCLDQTLLYNTSDTTSSSDSGSDDGAGRQSRWGKRVQNDRSDSAARARTAVDEAGDLIVRRRSKRSRSEQPAITIRHCAEAVLVADVGLQVWRGACLLCDWLLSAGGCSGGGGRGGGGGGGGGRDGGGGCGSGSGGRGSPPAVPGSPGVRGAVVVELGGGVGLGAVAAAMAGAARVVVTDVHAGARALAAANVAANSPLIAACRRRRTSSHYSPQAQRENAWQQQQHAGDEVRLRKPGQGSAREASRGGHADSEADGTIGVDVEVEVCPLDWMDFLTYGSTLRDSGSGSGGDHQGDGDGDGNSRGCRDTAAGGGGGGGVAGKGSAAAPVGCGGAGVRGARRRVSGAAILRALQAEDAAAAGQLQNPPEVVGADGSARGRAAGSAPAAAAGTAEAAAPPLIPPPAAAAGMVVREEAGIGPVLRALEQTEAPVLLVAADMAYDPALNEGFAKCAAALLEVRAAALRRHREQQEQEQQQERERDQQGHEKQGTAGAGGGCGAVLEAVPRLVVAMERRYVFSLSALAATAPAADDFMTYVRVGTDSGEQQREQPGEGAAEGAEQARQQQLHHKDQQQPRQHQEQLQQPEQQPEKQPEKQQQVGPGRPSRTPLFTGRRLSLERVPQVLKYERCPQLELWELTLLPVGAEGGPGARADVGT